MRVLLINVPHPAIGSRIPREQLPPLGLLAVGGPLIDDGHEVRLLDGEFGPMTTAALVGDVIAWSPDAVLFGHSGSSSGHPVIAVEAVAQLRSRSLRRWAWNSDPKIRHAVRWYYRMGRRVWINEWLNFLIHDRPRADGRTVADHFGAVQDHEEEASLPAPPPARRLTAPRFLRPNLTRRPARLRR